MMFLKRAEREMGPETGTFGWLAGWLVCDFVRTTHGKTSLVALVRATGRTTFIITTMALLFSSLLLESSSNKKKPRLWWRRGATNSGRLGSGGKSHVWTDFNFLGEG